MIETQTTKSYYRIHRRFSSIVFPRQTIEQGTPAFISMQRLSALLSVLSDEGTFNHLDLEWQLQLFSFATSSTSIHTSFIRYPTIKKLSLHSHSVAHSASFGFDWFCWQSECGCYKSAKGLTYNVRCVMIFSHGQSFGQPCNWAINCKYSQIRHRWCLGRLAALHNSFYWSFFFCSLGVGSYLYLAVVYGLLKAEVPPHGYIDILFHNGQGLWHVML